MGSCGRSGLGRDAGRGRGLLAFIPLIPVNLGGEGGEVLPFTAVKAEARCSPDLSLKYPGLINGACTMDGMLGRWGLRSFSERDSNIV